MPTTLDTLAYAKRLREAGVPEAQADAQAEALNAFRSDAASKSDVELARTELAGRITAAKTELEGRIAALNSRVTQLQRMMGINFALTVAILGNLLIGH